MSTGKQSRKPRRGGSVSDSKNSTPPSHLPGGGGFAPGNKCGKGNPHLARLAAYRQMVNKTLTPKRLRKVLLKLYSLAREGDMLAVKEVLYRTIGKVKSMDAETAARIELPELTNAKDTVKASNAILRAMTDGRLTPDDGAKLAAIVDLARRSLETNELAERLGALERRAAQRER